MKKDTFHQSLKIIRHEIRNLINAGYSESELKRIVGFAIIHELFADKTEEERINFVLNSDFFFDHYLKNIPVEELSAELILKSYGIYTPEREKFLKKQLQEGAEHKHHYSNFLE